MNSKNVYQSAMQAIDRFIESLHDVQSPFEFATSLVRVTAQQYNADITTLFRVTTSKTELIAEAGYDQKGEELKANASYYLNWDAKAESDMAGGGLTAWVAVSGKPLFIANAEELLDKKLHPAHRGVWDSELHPTGPEYTFGCLYAVPLKVTERNEKHPRESVLGVYKIERRKNNKDGIFTREQLSEFDLAAKQISLVILLYERAMARVLSDARHAVSGRLSDAIQQLDMVHAYFDPTKPRLYNLPWGEKEKKLVRTIERVQADANKVASWLRQSMQVYMNPYESDRRTLGEFVQDTIEARGNQQQEVHENIPDTDRGIQIKMSVAQSWDLHTLLLSILNNAIEHSGRPDTVSFRAEVVRPEGKAKEQAHIIFTIEDHGRGISEKLIKAAQAEGGAMPPSAARGTGLRRVFQVARFREWQVTWMPQDQGIRFKVQVEVTK